MEIMVCGWKGTPPDAIAAILPRDARIVARERLVAAVASRVGPFVLVLDEDEWDLADSTAIASHLRGRRCCVLLVAADATAPIVPATDPVVALAEAIGVEDIGPRLARIGRYGLRPLLDAQDWAPENPPRGSDGHRVAMALAHTALPTFARWRQGLGLDGNQLRIRVRQALGRTPREVHVAYREAIVALEQTDGRTLASIAEALGYSEASALGRAIRNRKDPPAPSSNHS